MIVRNIKDFDDVKLYWCEKNRYIDFLKAGFEPVLVEDRKYYFILDEKLKSFLSKK